MQPATVGSPLRVEPTVLGAMRRHLVLVYIFVLASLMLAFVVSVLMPQQYRASVTVSSPRPAGSVLQSDQQYLDSQVTLLNSREVGDLALAIARQVDADTGIAREDLVPTLGEVEIRPPTGDSSASYGTTIVTIGFRAPSADEAQAGANALAAAYDQVRSDQIAAQAEARLMGVDRAIEATDLQDDLSALRRERVRALIDQGRDYALTASIGSAERPTAPTGTSAFSLLAAALCFGIVGGGTAAFIRASRLQHVGAVEVADRIYGAPLLGEHRPTAPKQDTADLTEQEQVLGRAVAHRLRTFEALPCVAVVATPMNSGRSMSAARLALALARQDVPVLAVDGGDGTLTRRLRAVALTSRETKIGKVHVRPSLMHHRLSVLDVSAPQVPAWTRSVVNFDGDVVVVDCPPPATSPKAVDLLSHCDAAVVLVRAQDPAPDHLEVARWLDLTGTVVLGYVFTPYQHRGPLQWRPGRARPTAPAPTSENTVPVVDRQRPALTPETSQARVNGRSKKLVPQVRN